MNVRHKLRAKCVVDRAVAANSAEVTERVSTDGHMEMAFTAILIPGMPAMAFAVIAHHKFRG